MAIDLPPGEEWLDVLADLWWRGVSAFPIDHRLTVREKRALLDIARPSLLVGPDGDTVFPDVGVTDPETASVVIATSGTSGPPRLAELGRPALEGAIERANAAIEVTVDTPWLAVLTPAHVGGLLVYLRAAIYDTPVAAHERFAPEALAELGAVCTSVVPTMVHRLVEAAVPLEDVTLIVGAAPLDRATRGAAQLAGARVFQTYGMTETCGGTAYDGVPLADVDVRIGDGGVDRAAQPDAVLGVPPRPAGHGRGVHDRRLVPHPRPRRARRRWPPDRARPRRRRDPHRGETVWPDEVEAALRAHPEVADAAVAGPAGPGVGEPRRGVGGPGRRRRPADPRGAPRRTAGSTSRASRLPKEIAVVETLPRTTTGKTRRHELS